MVNVKAGDLAVIISSNCGNEFKIVRVLRSAIKGDRLPGRDVGVYDPRRTTYVAWHVESQGGPLRTRTFGGVEFISQCKIIADMRLRKIVEADGPDEMLAITGKPPKIIADSPVEGPKVALPEEVV